jgi:uncharacterized protein YjbJ (UPF0337 family)
MNEEILKGKWKEIKGEVQRTWGNLTNDELEKAKGNATSIAGLVQQKYGMKKEEAESQVNDLFGKFGRSTDENAQKIKDNLKH